MKRLLSLLLLALAFNQLACSDDCDTLADDVCTRLGEQHEGCKRVRKRNETASQDDKRLCGEVLALTQRLTPKN